MTTPTHTIRTGIPILDRAVQAFNERDLAALRRLWTENAVIQVPGRAPLRGGTGRPDPQRSRSSRHGARYAHGRVAANAPVPQQAIDLMAKPLVFRWLYRLLGSRSWRRRAQRFGAEHGLDAMPYARDPDRNPPDGTPR